MKKGFSFASFGAVIHVNPDTLAEWAKVHKSFSDAKQTGRMYERLFWEGLLIKASTGDSDKIEIKTTKYDKSGHGTGASVTKMPGKMTPATILFALKNKFPEDWKDRREVDMTLVDDKIETMTDEELTKERQNLEAKISGKKKKDSTDG